MIPFSLKVSYNRGQYIATVGCNGIKGPANVEKFECDGKIVSVQEYFETKLRTKLQYPYLPCVWVGSREKKNLVPMEVNSLPSIVLISSYLTNLLFDSCVRLQKGKNIVVS
jgi:hypothetical protein